MEIIVKMIGTDEFSVVVKRKQKNSDHKFQMSLFDFPNYLAENVFRFWNV